MIEERKHLEPPSEGVLSYVLDLGTEALAWSDELYTVFNYERSGAPYNLQWWTEHIHSDDAMALNEAMDMLMHPWVKEWTVDYRFEKAGQGYVPVHDQASVVRDGNGKAIRLVGKIWQATES